MNFSPDSFPWSFLPGGIVWVFVVSILTAIIHIAFAFAVIVDAERLQRLHRKTFFVGGGLWALATLFGGVFIAAIYWLIHHSTLRPQQLPEDLQSESASTQPQPKAVSPEEY